MSKTRAQLIIAFGKHGIPANAVETLFARYGSNTAQILRSSLTFNEQGMTPEESLLRAEVSYCISHEMVCLPEDFTFRRTSLAYFKPGKLSSVQAQIERIVYATSNLQ